MRQAEKEKKKFYFRIPFILDSGKKIPKKITNKLKKLKNLFPTLFLAKTGWDRPRKREKHFTPEFRSYSTQTKKKAKKLKKLKNLFPTLFLAKTGWDRPKNREKNFTPEFRAYSTQTRKFQKNSKKIEEIKKPLSDIIFNQNGMR